MDPITARMSSLSDQQLVRVVTEDRESWSAEALEIAQAEIKSRGLIVPPNAPTTPRKRTATIGLTWAGAITLGILLLKFYFLLALP